MWNNYTRKVFEEENCDVSFPQPTIWYLMYIKSTRMINMLQKTKLFVFIFIGQNKKLFSEREDMFDS